MLKEKPVIGAFISDDFFFFFEEESIKTLARLKKITGIFMCHDNKPPRKLLNMRLIVSVFKPNKIRLSKKISISFGKKCVHFYITENDFDDCFIHPSDWVRDNGPSWRDCDSNIYITRGASKNSSIRKAELINLIA
jgi:hypothetical protein